MKKTIFIIVLVCCGFSAAAQSKSTTFKFKGGTCELSELNMRPMFAPAEMKDSEKAFMARFAYKLDADAADDALSVLYDKGQFVTPDGAVYKAGAAIRNETLYSLVVAVPKDVDVETLKFVFNNQSEVLKRD